MSKKLDQVGGSSRPASTQQSTGKKPEISLSKIINSDVQVKEFQAMQVPEVTIEEPGMTMNPKKETPQFKDGAKAKNKLLNTDRYSKQQMAGQVNTDQKSVKTGMTKKSMASHIASYSSFGDVDKLQDEIYRKSTTQKVDAQPRILKEKLKLSQEQMDSNRKSDLQQSSLNERSSYQVSDWVQSKRESDAGNSDMYVVSVMSGQFGQTPGDKRTTDKEQSRQYYSKQLQAMAEQNKTRKYIEENPFIASLTNETTMPTIKASYEVPISRNSYVHTDQKANRLPVSSNRQNSKTMAPKQLQILNDSSEQNSYVDYPWNNSFNGTPQQTSFREMRQKLKNLEKKYSTPKSGDGSSGCSNSPPISKYPLTNQLRYKKYEIDTEMQAQVYKEKFMKNIDDLKKIEEKYMKSGRLSTPTMHTPNTLATRQIPIKPHHHLDLYEKDLRRSNQNISNQYTNSSDDILTNLQNRNEYLEGQLLQSFRNHRQQESQIGQLKKEIDELRKGPARIDQKLLDRVVKDIRSDYENQIRRDNSKIADLERKLAARDIVLPSSPERQKVKTLESDLSLAHSQMAKMQKQIEYLQKQLLSKKGEKAEKPDEIIVAKLQEDNEKINQKLEASKKENQKLITKILQINLKKTATEAMKKFPIMKDTKRGTSKVFNAHGASVGMVSNMMNINK